MMLIRLAVVVLLAVSCSNAFVAQPSIISPQQQQRYETTSRAASTTSIDSMEQADTVLREWDTYFSNQQSKSNTKKESDDSLESRLLPQLKDAIALLNQAATDEREATRGTGGRVMLGICADSAEQGLGCLKSWVPSLQLPRGLLHGMDDNGVPIEIKDGVYIKYNSGGVYTFADIRKSGKGFDALWKPGDAMLEEYDGDYRGVYFQVELEDEVFRQYLVPMNVFDDDE